MALGVCAGILAGLGSCTLALRSCIRSGCWEVGNDTPSPSGRYIARVSLTGCPGLGGDSTSDLVTIRNVREPGSAGREVFISDENQPSVSWKDDGHLIITVHGVSQISKSELRYGDVHISYEVPFDYSLEHLRAMEDQYEQRMRAAYGNRRSTVTGDQEQDNPWLQKLFATMRERNKQFHDWAVRVATP